MNKSFALAAIASAVQANWWNQAHPGMDHSDMDDMYAPKQQQQHQ